MPTQAQINQAYFQLKTALLTYGGAKNNLLHRQHLYDSTLAFGIASGEIGNKNDQERLGGMLEKYPEIVTTYQRAKVGEQEAKLQLDLAKLEVEHLQTLIEVAKGTNHAL